MDPQTVQEIKPLVIRTAEGGILDVSLMSPKSHSKSIERDELWHLHRQTGRTLPYSERVDLQELKARENWYEAVVIVAGGEAEEAFAADREADQQAAFEAAELEKPAALRRSHQNQHQAHTIDTARTQAYQHHASEGDTKQGRLQAEGHGPGQTEAAPEQGAAELRASQLEGTAQGGCGQVLERLEAIVEERRQRMPEGSYTTHLFASGAEKIRKKAGEEAVELILASSREQIVYEAADLLYHMCVLLVSEGISYGEVCGELQERHATG